MSRFKTNMFTLEFPSKRRISIYFLISTLIATSILLFPWLKYQSTLKKIASTELTINELATKQTMLLNKTASSAIEHLAPYVATNNASQIFFSFQTDQLDTFLSHLITAIKDEELITNRLDLNIPPSTDLVKGSLTINTRPFNETK